MTLEEYVKSNGYEVSDLTEQELKDAAEELELINKEGAPNFLDGVFSPQGTLWIRKFEQFVGDKGFDMETLPDVDKGKLETDFLNERLGIIVNDGPGEGPIPVPDIES